jgi:SAM-dependent methyltransferase
MWHLPAGLPSPSVTNRWLKLVEENPDHSARYVQRFKDMAAEGKDLDGEARLVDAMVRRRSRILDAGCGPGRVGGALHRLGHDVVGVDLDPELIAAAERDQPGPLWITADLAELQLGRTFDVIVCAGNVVTFLAPQSRAEVLSRLAKHLVGDGRLVVGFGAGRDYEFEEFRSDVASAGLAVDLELATWDLRPTTPESDFLVALMSRSDN